MKSNFSIKELLAKCSESERAALFASPALSRNLILLAQALQGIRDLLGLPLVVNSSYRDQQHNKAVGGVPTSQHLTCSAADITCKSLPQLIQAIKEYQSESQQLGQVIVYDTFVHVGLADACNERFRTYNLIYN